MIALALVTLHHPASFFKNFQSIMNESDEFDNLLIHENSSKLHEEYNDDFFSIYPTYRDEDMSGLKNSKNYIQICEGLHVDKRTLPDYLQDWELKKIYWILKNYVSIAAEDLKKVYR